ncbi:hypothetical protein HN803_07270 [candidate division WWE3 bacterium]|jgi:hypothetical protein|nr:hypothetical protein [candidate division WWE3 bacterium]
MIGSKTEERILLEVAGKLEPARPDTPAEKVLRENLAKEIAEMEEKGIMVEIPFDWPEVDE